MSTKRRKGKRKGKQSSKPADQSVVRVENEQVASAVEVQVEVENLAGPVSLREEAERLASPVEIQDELENFASPADLPEVSENPAGPVVESTDREEPAPGSAAKTGADRRTHPRYAFTAAVEVIAEEPGARLKTRVRDLSQQGCNVDTDNPFALGTVTDVRITKGAESFAAHARVVYKQPGKGMGLMFTVVEPEQLATLNRWITESREVSWLAANRRRSQRGKRRAVLSRRHLHTGDQRAWSFDFDRGASVPGAAVHAVEHADKGDAGVCCGPRGQGSRRGNSGGGRVHAAERNVLARGVSAEGLDAAASRREVGVTSQPAAASADLSAGSSVAVPTDFAEISRPFLFISNLCLRSRPLTNSRTALPTAPGRLDASTLTVDSTVPSVRS